MLFSGSGVALWGEIAKDGLSLTTCSVKIGIRTFPCVVVIKNLTGMNVTAYYHKDGSNDGGGKHYGLCVAVDNKSYNVDCE
jgi:hypothetical protein